MLKQTRPAIMPKPEFKPPTVKQPKCKQPKPVNRTLEFKEEILAVMSKYTDVIDNAYVDEGEISIYVRKENQE